MDSPTNDAAAELLRTYTESGGINYLDAAAMLGIAGAVVAFNVEGLHPHDGAALLDEKGIAVRAGHHCAQPLMKRLGIVGTLRASFSVYNTPAEVERLAEAVRGLRGAL